MASPGRRAHIADAAALESWAQRIEARSDFPRLARRLIRQTNDQVISLEMRAAEGTGYRGYDGRVEALKATPFVPVGLSVWELGVSENPASKATEDYEKRTNDSLGVEKSEATFVFVTARRWSGRTEWEREKRAEAHWANVRAFDADDIELAFESAPAAHHWFSELIGLPVDGVRMVEHWWDAFSRTSRPNLTPELVLAGRADDAAALLRILEEETRITVISAASTDDVLAFVAATLLSAPAPTSADLLARALIVHDAAALRRLDATTDLLVLLPFDDELRREAQLVRSHHVILLAPGDIPADIQLPPVDRDSFAANLERSGLGKDLAADLARAAHRSLVAFQAESPARGAPRRDWSTAFESVVVRRAYLAGGWHEARSGDVDALVALFGTGYDDARSELQPFTRGEDPIFVTVGGTWGLTSVHEAWHFAAAHFTRFDLAEIEIAIQTVLGAVDPALELPVEERWLAGVRGKTRIHSSDLRRGLATTLAACGAFGEAAQLGGGGSISDWAASVIRQLLGRANEDQSGDLWASLADVLPLLAEAAPESFLRAAQEGLREGPQPLLGRMFLDHQGDALTVNSPHTGLLWALEGLAWSSEHGSLAVMVIARLAEVDPGGRLRNRPLSSLVDIFRPWLPQTSLQLERRIAVIDALRRDYPEIAWRLMLGLLPEFHGVGNYTHSPRFRTWKSEEQTVTNGERWEFDAAVARRLLDDVRPAPGRWVDLAEQLSRFPQQERSSLLAELEELAASETLEAELRARLWDELDKLVRHHRAFPDADWSLPSEELDRLGGVADSLRPQDPTRAHAWLFDEPFPDIGDQRLDYDDQEARVEEARSSAITEIRDARGDEGLLQFAREVQVPGAVGASLALTPTEDSDAWMLGLLDHEDPQVASCARGYIFRRTRQAQGLNWIEKSLPKLAGRPVGQARLLEASADLPAAWDIAAGLGREVEEAYWREFFPMGRGPEFNLVNEAARSLLKFGRPIAALHLLALYARKKDRRVASELVVEALQELVRLPAEHDETQRLASYQLETLLDYLYDSNVDEEELGVLEWRLLPARSFDARSPVLERRLARDPAFFVEILSLVYRPRDEDAEVAEVPAHVATNAYRLLDEWKIVPGSTSRQGEVDPDALGAWIDEARKRARDAGRGEIGDDQIGKVLAHARGDEDGTWPTRAVRDLIERVGSSELEDGFEVEIYNSRGSTSRGLLDGGAQERELAQNYDALAARVRDGWPRTAAILTTLARGYEREARRFDEEAERFRQGMDR